MTDKKRIVYIVLAAALLVVVILIIFAVSRSGQLSPDTTPAPTETAQPLPDATAAPAPVSTPAPTPTPTSEPTEELPVITPPAAEPEPATGSDIVLTPAVPASDTDIPAPDTTTP